jgi:hypothetical protein
VWPRWQMLAPEVGCRTNGKAGVGTCATPLMQGTTNASEARHPERSCLPAASERVPISSRRAPSSSKAVAIIAQRRHAFPPRGGLAELSTRCVGERFQHAASYRGTAGSRLSEPVTLEVSRACVARRTVAPAPVGGLGADSCETSRSVGCQPIRPPHVRMLPLTLSKKGRGRINAIGVVWVLVDVAGEADAPRHSGSGWGLRRPKPWALAGLHVLLRLDLRGLVSILGPAAYPGRDRASGSGIS